MVKVWLSLGTKGTQFTKDRVLAKLLVKIWERLGFKMTTASKLHYLRQTDLEIDFRALS